MKLHLLMVPLLLCTTGISQIPAQTKRKRILSPDKQNTIVAEVIKKMTEPSICGDPEWAAKEFYSGAIVKRDFAENEVEMKGFVLADAKDSRTYFNIDTEYVAGLAASASGDLADFLTKGRRIKVWAYRCSHILYAYKISSF